MNKNGGFCIFQEPHIRVSSFFARNIVSGGEKSDVFIFLWKFEKLPFFPTLTQIWPKFGQNDQNLRFAIFISLQEKRFREMACFSLDMVSRVVF